MKFGINRRLAVLLVIPVVILAGVLTWRLAFNPAPAGTKLDDGQPMSMSPSTEQMITQLQEGLRSNPQNTAGYANLGWAFLQRVRETGDASLYARAETAFGEALKRDPQQIDALTGMGSLALSRHQFADGIRWGEQARDVSPDRAQVYGIIADGQTELGRYDDAVATLQSMVDARPDLNSYSRISYARELHGDIPGAIDAMQSAIAAGNPLAEGTLWTQVQLGNLFFNGGDMKQAEGMYNQALNVKPDYVYAQAGIAKVRAAQGRYDEAIRLYRSAIDRLPLPEFIIPLVDLYDATGQTAAAKKEADLVRVIEQLYISAGVDVDMELALFEADHGGDPAKVVAQARTAFSHRPTLYAADTLAWALYQAGKPAEAQSYSQQALKLGTRDALLHFHAAMIARALGDKASARDHLQQAAAINPAFSIRYAGQARQLLVELTQPGS